MAGSHEAAWAIGVESRQQPGGSGSRLVVADRVVSAYGREIENMDKLNARNALA
jgi:hypothetical protein